MNIDFMKRAIELAEECAKHDEVPVGAVIVKDGKIIAESGNRKERDNCAVSHAEILAIQKATEVERAVDDLYKAKYMENFIGREFDAVISGVTAFGVFSELENSVEGITKLEDLPRGNYVFDQKSYKLSCSKHSFSLGEKVRVGVLDVDLSARRTEFIILYKIK